jgi:hypothetical protein
MAHRAWILVHLPGFDGVAGDAAARADADSR